MGADQYRRELDLHLITATPFADIEDWIDGLPLSDDAKAGLWLLAWAEQDRAAQRRIADEALAAASP